MCYWRVLTVFKANLSSNQQFHTHTRRHETVTDTHTHTHTTHTHNLRPKSHLTPRHHRYNAAKRGGEVVSGWTKGLKREVGGDKHVLRQGANPRHGPH